MNFQAGYSRVPPRKTIQSSCIDLHGCICIPKYKQHQPTHATVDPSNSVPGLVYHCLGIKHAGHIPTSRIVQATPLTQQYNLTMQFNRNDKIHKQFPTLTKMDGFLIIHKTSRFIIVLVLQQQQTFNFIEEKSLNYIHGSQPMPYGNLTCTKPQRLYNTSRVPSRYNNVK